MYKEWFKSILLIAIVASSAILTYLVWSYEPEFSQIDTTIEGTTNISQGERVSFEQVMSTYQMVWIQGENNTRGTTDPRALIGIREHLDGSSVVSMNVYNNLNRLDVRGEESNDEEFLLIDYYSDVPSKSLFMMLGLSHEPTLPDFTFDRIVVDMKEGNVVFNLIDENRSRVAVVETSITADFLKGHVESYSDIFEAYTPIITNQRTSNNKTAIYGPSSPGSSRTERFMISQVNADVLNRILFLNSPEESPSSGDVAIYEDENHIATYNSETYQYNYTNLNESSASSGNNHQTIQDIYYFLNSHNGLSTSNVLFDYDAGENAATFRSTLNGRVIFSEGLSSAITVKYGRNAVYEYTRPLIRTNAKVSDEEEVELLDIETVRYQIALHDKFDLQKVSKIVLGYDMTYADDQTDVEFIDYTPQWYVKYDGVWMKFNEGGLS
ncbi:YycH protein [Jeotgalicoccus saudimassiliensis]|uniref:YycH protein n=1 Tax=Jeotgalicoccus saudimassiliensis TaxID=1461582 RepID=A0A078MBZ5_9STAP|nr:two-component system activity regulator YycH [Jeotgalicoccus saudimassiliensis]CEA02201.1 YycH protein [Jeotgalicoccus saudimassiliensis]